jgi:hypothetical protein
VKPYLIRLSAFFLFALLFYIGYVILSGLLLPDFIQRNLIYTLGGNGFTYTRLQEAKNAGQVDILFLGSSRAYRGFDTRIFEKAGFSAFNLGSSNQTPIQTLYLLKKYLDCLHPKIIVFEVNPDIFSNNGVESAIDMISNERMNLSMINMAAEINDIKVWNTLIYATFRKSIGMDDHIIETKNKNNQSYIPDGYVQNTDQYYHNETGNTYVCHLNKRQMTAFEKIMHTIKTEKINIILVQAPVVSSLYRTCSENEKFDHLMLQQETYYNFNKLLNLSDSLDFYDGQHLNQRGVQKLNGEILKIVMEKK